MHTTSLIGPQPDFVVLRESLSQVGVQLERFANIPAIVQGDILLQQMQQITQQNERFQR